MTTVIKNTKFDVQIETWSKGDVIYQQETVPHWLFEGEREQLSFRLTSRSEECPSSHQPIASSKTHLSPRPTSQRRVASS